MKKKALMKTVHRRIEKKEDHSAAGQMLNGVKVAKGQRSKVSR